MKNIEDIRASIDALDSRMAALLIERLELADAIAEAKRASGGPVSDPVREREIPTRLPREVGPRCGRDVRTVYSTLFGVSNPTFQEKRENSGIA